MENKDKDKEILFSEEAQKKFAEMMAKLFMPDTKILEQLGAPSGDIKFNEDKWTYEIKDKENGFNTSSDR